MLKKTMTYTDYNGVTRTEEFYFNLTQAEVTEMEMSVDGGLVEMIKRITAAKDGRQIIGLLKDVILRAYGVKSDDGRRFIKNQEVRDAFAQSEVYSDLFMELATDSESAAAFVAGIIPAQKGDAPKINPAQAQLVPGTTG